MTISLPSGWGPATVLIVLYALATAVGGIIQMTQGDLTYQAWIESMQWPALALGGLAVGRGVAYGGAGTGFKNEAGHGGK